MDVFDKISNPPPEAVNLGDDASIEIPNAPETITDAYQAATAGQTVTPVTDANI